MSHSLDANFADDSNFLEHSGNYSTENNEDYTEEPSAAGGVPADLIPYLEEADIPSVDSSTAQLEEENSEDKERTSALRALVEHSLLLGPDPQILREIETEDAGDFNDESDDDIDDNDKAASLSHGGEHKRALDGAELAAEHTRRVKEIYDAIVERAPEHKFEPTLDRVAKVMDILGNPQNSYHSIHITGTNGKTSTARMIDSVFSELGLKVGRFTSPHLRDVRERISIGGAPISQKDFIDAFEDVAPYIEIVDQQSQENGGPRLSFFEVFTVMALAKFADVPVDIAVVEVGMGGRWDSTNVIDGDVGVIMPIDLDHQKWLGSTIADIAHEKAGIIKPKQRVVIAKQPEAAMSALMDRVRDVDAIARIEGVDYDVLSRQMGVGGQMVTIRTPAGIYEDIFVPLLGEHQAHNAAAALVAVESLMGGRQLDGTVVERGFMNATSPGRLEVIRTSPTIILDGAHNPAGARVLARALEESFDFSHLVGVFSAMSDKDVESILSEVESIFERIIITEMDGERAMSPLDLVAIAENVFGEDRVDYRGDMSEALVEAVTSAESSSDPADTTGVVVFGSIHLVGNAETLLKTDRLVQ